MEKMKRVLPKDVAAAQTDKQKTCDHEWINVRKGHMPIVWVHQCKKCKLEIPI